MTKENEENVFDEMSENEFLEEEAQPEENKQLDEEEMMPGDMTSFKYLKNPGVGESIELSIAKIVKKKGRELKNKTNGETFWTGLKSKKQTDEERVETIIETTSNERFNVTSWGLWFNLFGEDSLLQKKAKEQGSYKNIKIKITHLLNGKDATTSSQDLMKLRDFKTLEEAEEHKKNVGKAMKDGTLYTVEILQ